MTQPLYFSRHRNYSPSELEAMRKKSLAQSERLKLPEDEWTHRSFPELSPSDNETIRTARRKGFDVFYPAFPDAKAQAKATLKGATEFLLAGAPVGGKQ